MILVLIIGVIFGSYISAQTWRIGRNVKNKSRSVCDKCGNQLLWKDNIPLLSYCVLKGKCRFCNKKISKRYPIVEISTGMMFVLIWFAYNNCNLSFFVNNIICQTKDQYLFWTLPYLMIISIIMISIFVVDFERMFIPDIWVFIGFTIVFGFLVITHSDNIYKNLSAGAIASLSLLSIHLLTKGKGMGLGDVKFALFAGSFMGMPNFIYWLFFSFLTGGAVAIILLLRGKAKLKQKIAFGPFLVIGFFITLFFSGIIDNIFYLNVFFQ